tara:strand:+ start:6045 stop:6215 length:171 start_codon:yes stop_codon:yes gene_type:complete
MGTERKFIWSNVVFEELRNNGNIHFFVGRGKKGQGVFLPLCFPAAEGVKKPETERF